MNRNAPVLSADLLRDALAVPAGIQAPADMRSTIRARVEETEQRRPSVGVRLSTGFGALPRRAQVAAVFLLVAALVLSATAVGMWLLNQQRPPLGDSPTYRGDAARTGLSWAAGPGAAMTAAWHIQLPDQIVTSPAIAAGVAYVPVLDGSLLAFDLADGHELWRADVGASFSSPSIAGDVILLGSDTRELVAVDRATGSVAWRIQLAGFAAGSPAVVGTRAFIATSSDEVRGRHDPTAIGTVIAVDLTTRAIVWQESLPGPSTQSVAAGSGIIVAPTDAGIAVAYDQGTGSERWRASTGVEMDTPVIVGDRVLLAGLDLEGTDGALWAVDLGSGRSLWQYRRPNDQTVFAPGVDEASGMAFAGAVDGELVAVGLRDGTEAWSVALGHEVAAAPTLASGVAYVPTLDGIFAVDLESRAVIGRFATDGIPFTPAVAQGAMVIGTTSGGLVRVVGSEDPGLRTGGPGTSDAATRAPPPTTAPSAGSLTEVWQLAAADLGIDGAYFPYLNAAPDGTVWLADSARGGFVIVDADGSVVETWTPTGDAALDLVQPDGNQWGAVAFLADGGFVIADTDHQRVVRFDADRELVASWGEFGSGPGQFISPFGIAAGPDERIYVVDDVTCRVQVFDDAGAYLRTVAGTPDLRNSCTNNVAVDADGTVFLASGGRGTPWRISVFAPDGTLAGRLGEGLLREPALLAVGPGGELYTTDGTDRLDRIGRDGTLIASWTGADLELAVIGPGGEVYATGLTGIVHRYEAR